MKRLSLFSTAAPGSAPEAVQDSRKGSVAMRRKFAARALFVMVVCGFAMISPAQAQEEGDLITFLVPAGTVLPSGFTLVFIGRSRSTLFVGPTCAIVAQEYPVQSVVIIPEGGDSAIHLDVVRIAEGIEPTPPAKPGTRLKNIELLADCTNGPSEEWQKFQGFVD